ncbi:transcriptional activator srcap [Fusarium napiforme]|uniref:Transcriptional activator srcap n=1 Tax=Fusarium napiforme TaxID=42672 RepID=A0A8H5J7L1_9HYPO|nr:transcriptional activator srcap [Fusarium napiforme]
MLDVNAVLFLQFNPDMQIRIYGVAIRDVPFLAADIKFTYAELRIACTLDIDASSSRLDAQLSPQSFVFDEGCHLTAGIDLSVWFDAFIELLVSFRPFHLTAGGGIAEDDIGRDQCQLGRDGPFYGQDSPRRLQDVLI